METTKQIGDNIEAFLISWKNAQKVQNRGHSNCMQSEIVKWTKPVAGRFKCKVDASSPLSLTKSELELVFEMQKKTVL